MGIVNVTQPTMPPLEEFIPYLEKIWESKWLTNNGQFHQALEFELCKYLGVEHISLFTNATIALVTALQALEIKGEVITTPYSFVATAHSLLWNNITPVFVDIEPSTMNIDPDKLEQAITPNTEAIMPVHCYGNPCNVEKIQEVAKKYGLKVIYDAAHAFGISYKGSSLLVHGDLSVVSFHATKVFNTFEGGAIISKDLITKQKIDFLKNFGFADELTVVAPGINGKMNELQAAFGMLQLKHIDLAIQKRRAIHDRYQDGLQSILGIRLLEPPVHGTQNYSYYPILITSEYYLSRDVLYQRLRDSDIYSRRYFYPLISDMPMYKELGSASQLNLPIAHKISNEILCLPIYPDLNFDDVDKIIKIIKNS